MNEQKKLIERIFAVFLADEQKKTQQSIRMWSERCDDNDERIEMILESHRNFVRYINEFKESILDTLGGWHVYNQLVHNWFSYYIGRIGD